nr:MAG TPA: hypothetical protein [Caudoviricetes sp.]
METLIVYMVSLVFALGFLGWLHTKKGKKWLSDL